MAGCAFTPLSDGHCVDDDDDEDDEEEDDEDEPVFKFSSIINPSKVESTNKNESRRLPMPDFSCLAVHERFLVIGRMTGDLLVTDHLGHEMPHFQMKAHDYPVNAISIDDAGEFVGSCCQGGKVKISGLLSKDNDQLFTFSRPVRAVCLDPNFSKTKMFVTGITNVILNERGTFGRHKQTVLIELGGGLIHTLQWKDSYIAFGNDKGVGIYDLQTRRLLGFEEISGPKEMAAGLFPSQISWNDSTTLAIACGQTIQIVKIVTETMNAHQSGAIKKYLNTIYRFKIEFYACGLTSVAGDLILLGIERFNTTEGSADPSLTILSKNETKYAEKAHDPFHLQNERETNPSQFHLEYLPDENSFFILSPYEIMKAERRDFDDHIDFLISKKKFQEAIQVFEKPNRRDAVARRHTQKSVYREFVEFLMQNDQIDRAVTFFERIYTTQNDWEEQIRTFIRLNKLDLIVPHIPTEKLKLSSEIYELVLTTYLNQKQYEKFLNLLKTWPTNLYSLTSIDQKIRLATNDQNPPEILLECSAFVAEKEGNLSRTLDILLKMGNVQVFQLIERKKLYADVLPHIEKLMMIDEKVAVEMLMRNIDRLPVNAVAESLEKSARLLHKYLDAVFTHNPNDSRDFHTRQVSLYAQFEPEKLMQFLRKAGNYNLQEALAICEQGKLHREMVFLYGRAGNGPVALQIILKELKDIQLAISFCRETGSRNLWESLIQQSRDKPDYIKGLLDHAGSDVDLKDLIDQMRTDLKVPGLRDSLCKIMQDHNIQMSLSECCRKIIVHDCLSLRKQTVTLLQHGYLVKDSDICAKCHNPLYTAGHSGNPQVSVFFCLHVFHGKCIENHPDVCGVCSTSSLFPTA